MIKERSDVCIRWMVQRDLPEVVAIEQACRGQWAAEDFVAIMRRRNCIGMVGTVGEENNRLGQVVGYMIYELHEFKFDLLTLAVDPQHHRRRIGSQLVAKLVAKMSPARRASITTSICETNLGGQLFLRRQGFRATRVSRNQFTVGTSAFDGYQMVLALGGRS